MQHPELTHEECDQGRAVAWGAAPEEAAALRRMYPAKAARYGAVAHALATAASVEQRNVALGMGLRHIVDIAVLRALIEAGAQVNEPGLNTDGSDARPIFWAVSARQAPALKLLLDSKARADVAQDDGSGPLAISSEIGDDQLV